MAVDPQIQQAINAFSQQISAAGSTFAQALQNISRQTSVHGDNIRKESDRITRTLKMTGDQLAGSVRSLSEILNDERLATAASRQREILQERLNNESHFFSRDKIHREEELKSKADALQRNRELAERALGELQRQQADKINQQKQATANEAKQAADAAASKKKLDAAAAQAEKTRQQIAAKREKLSQGQLNQADHDALKKELERDEALQRRHEKQEAQAKREFDKTNAAHKATKKSLQDINDSLQKLGTNINKTGNKLAETNKAIDGVVDDMKKNRLGAAVQKFKKEFEDGIKNKLFSGALVTAGLKNLGSEIRTGIDRGVGMLDGKEQWKVTDLGMSGKEFMEATGEYRSAMIAAGGMGKSLESLQAGVKNLRGHVASNAEAAKFNMQQMQMMTTMGITPTTDRLKKMGNNFKEIHRVTGMTADQFNTSMRDIMENEDMLQTMRLANTEAEREAIQDSVAARYKENRLRGVSDEQTRAMIKKQQQMANEKPLTRYQKAVKHAMLGGALGVAGSSELIQLSMIPDNLKTDAQRKREMEIRGGIDKGVSQGLGSRNFGTQIMTGELAEKSDWGRDMSVFNTKTSEAVQKGIENGFDKTFREMNGIFVAGNAVYEKLAGVMQNSWVQVGIGITGLLASFGFNTLATHLNTSALKANTIALAKSAAAGLLPETPGPGGKGKWKPRMPSGARLGGGIAGIAASMLGGAYMDSKVVEAEEKGDVKSAAKWDTGSAALAGAGWGATIGSFIPVVGTTVGAGVGALAGGAYGMYKNSDNLFGKDPSAFDKEEVKEATVKPEAKPSEELKQQQAQLQSTVETFNNQQVENTRQVEETIRATLMPVAQQTPAQRLASTMTPEVSATRTSMIGDLGSQIADSSAPTNKSGEKVSPATIDQQIAQLTQMELSNQALDKIAGALTNGTETLMDVAKKQLLAATLSEDEKKEVTKKNSSRGGAMTGLSNYQYI